MAAIGIFLSQVFDDMVKGDSRTAEVISLLDKNLKLVLIGDSRSGQHFLEQRDRILPPKVPHTDHVRQLAFVAEITLIVKENGNDASSKRIDDNLRRKISRQYRSVCRCCR